jgi:hypothetical protein
VIVLAALVAVSAFDLSCKTLFMNMGIDALPQKMSGETGPFFKINLTTCRFCQGSCSETYAIPKFTATDLILKAVNTKTDKQNL